MLDRTKTFFKNRVKEMSDMPGWISALVIILCAESMYFVHLTDELIDELKKQHATCKTHQEQTATDKDKEELCKKQSADYVFKNGKCYVLLKNIQKTH